VSNLRNAYREWITELPETTGDMIACVGYITWCAALTGAILTFEAGSFAPMSIFLGIAAIITILIYFP
jgi:hypothetical protein